MEKIGKSLRISFNSPVVLTFSLICLCALILGIITGDLTTKSLFCVYRSSLGDPLTYVRFIGHVFGHAGWDHFIGNITMLLVVGPMLEEKYGVKIDGLDIVPENYSSIDAIVALVNKTKEQS